LKIMFNNPFFIFFDEKTRVFYHKNIFSPLNDVVAANAPFTSSFKSNEKRL
jgi:hypothetical protein